jgi:hypothetical protein
MMTGIDQREGQPPRICIGKKTTLGLEKYPHPLQKRLGESPPKMEESNLWQNPAKGMARAPAAAAERRRWRQGRPGRVRVGTA